MNITQEKSDGSQLNALTGKHRKDWQNLRAMLTPSQIENIAKYNLLLMISKNLVPYVFTMYMSGNIARIEAYQTRSIRRENKLNYATGCITIFGEDDDLYTPLVLATSLFLRLRTSSGEEIVNTYTNWYGARVARESTYALVISKEFVDSAHALVTLVPQMIERLMNELGIKKLRIPNKL